MGLNITDITGIVDDLHLDDQTVSTSGGGFTFKRIPFGKHPVRLVQYIELGEHMVHNHTKKTDEKQDLVMLTFEFLGKQTIEQREDGKGEYAPRKSITLKKSYHEKATFRKLFDKMRNGDSTITNMVQMVGRGSWLMGVEWTTKGADGKRIVVTKANQAELEARAEANPDNKDFRIWDNMRNSEGYMITQAVREVYDEDSGEPIDTVAIKVREPIGDLALFVWDDPKPMLWDSLYIEGSYTKKVDGVETEISKNRHQNKIMEAVNFAGSPIEGMLGGVDDIGTDTGAQVSNEEGTSDVGKPAPQTDATNQTQALDTATSTTKSPSEEGDEFKELGM